METLKLLWKESPCAWPTIPRRVFLIFFPVTVPLWLSLKTAHFCAFLIMLAILGMIICPIGFIIKFWDGISFDQGVEKATPKWLNDFLTRMFAG